MEPSNSGDTEAAEFQRKSFESLQIGPLLMFSISFETAPGDPYDENNPAVPLQVISPQTDEPIGRDVPN